MERMYGLDGTPELIYENALAQESDVADFILEGSASLSFPNERLRMENALAAENGQKANYVLWCPENFPSDVMITWDFWPIREPGLCILFFAAAGRNGENLFDESLQKRTGEYPLYHHGDINAFHVSYYRRKEADERRFHTCNLRKSYGFHLVAQGGDPIPSVEDAVGPYHMTLIKQREVVRFLVDDLEVFRYVDDGVTYGPMLGGGKIGFRQLAPFIGEYAQLKVYSLSSKKEEEYQIIYEQIVKMIHKRHGNVSLGECTDQLNYHPSYIWKILKKRNTTFTNLVNNEKIKYARQLLAEANASVDEIALQLNYANTQNFIRFFNNHVQMTPGEYRRRNSESKKKME